MAVLRLEVCAVRLSLRGRDANCNATTEYGAVVSGHELRRIRVYHYSVRRSSGANGQVKLCFVLTSVFVLFFSVKDF